MQQPAGSAAKGGLCVNVFLCTCIWLLTLKAGITAYCKEDSCLAVVLLVRDSKVLEDSKHKRHSCL